MFGAADALSAPRQRLEFTPAHVAALELKRDRRQPFQPQRQQLRAAAIDRPVGELGFDALLFGLQPLQPLGQ
jgi:hypothetical protein